MITKSEFIANYLYEQKSTIKFVQISSGRI